MQNKQKLYCFAYFWTLLKVLVQGGAYKSTDKNALAATSSSRSLAFTVKCL